MANPARKVAAKKSPAKKAPAKKRVVKKMGRPVLDSAKLFPKIIQGLISGESLNALCRKPGMPSKPTVLRWLAASEEFCAQYARAKAIGAEAMAEDLLEIVDDGRNDWMERLGPDGQGTGWVLNGEAVRRSQLRADTRKWLLSKLAPKKYGEKLAVGGAEDLPPIAHAITGELVISPGEAYLRMVGKK